MGDVIVICPDCGLEEVDVAAADGEDEEVVEELCPDCAGHYEEDDEGTDG